MKQLKSTSFSQRGAAVIAALLFAFCTGGCNPAPQTSETPATEASPEKTKPFTVSSSVVAPKQAGADGLIHAEIKAAEGYHINDEYPLNFVPKGSSSGIAFDSKRIDLRNSVTKAACTKNSEETCSAKTKVTFHSTEDGAQKAEGVLAFSVCNPEQCIIERVKVGASFEVD